MAIKIPKSNKPVVEGNPLHVPSTADPATPTDDPLEAAAVPVPEMLPDNVLPKVSHEVAVAQAEEKAAKRREVQRERTEKLEAESAKLEAERIPKLRMAARVLEAEAAERTARLAWEKAKREMDIAREQAGHEGPRRWKVLNPTRQAVQLAGGQSAWLNPGDELHEDHYGGLKGIEALRESNPKLSLELIGG